MKDHKKIGPCGHPRIRTKILRNEFYQLEKTPQNRARIMSHTCTQDEYAPPPQQWLVYVDYVSKMADLQTQAISFFCILLFCSLSLIPRSHRHQVNLLQREVKLRDDAMAALVSKADTEEKIVTELCGLMHSNPRLFRAVVNKLSELLDKPHLLEAFESSETPRKQQNRSLHQ
jgi:hypothetical protein